MLIPINILEMHKYAEPDDQYHPGYTGIHITKKGDKAIALATNGKQLFRAEWDNSDDCFPDDFECTIPTYVFEQLAANPLVKSDLDLYKGFRPELRRIPGELVLECHTDETSVQIKFAPVPHKWTPGPARVCADHAAIEGHTVACNSYMLTELVELLSNEIDKGRHHVRIKLPHDETRPLSVENIYGLGPHNIMFYGLLMMVDEKGSIALNA